MPEAISSEASCSRVARALEGVEETTDWICRLTNPFRSSLRVMSPPTSANGQGETHIGTRSGSPLKRGST